MESIQCLTKAGGLYQYNGKCKIMISARDIATWNAGTSNAPSETSSAKATQSIPCEHKAG